MGQNMLLIHDLDGSVLGSGTGGQIMYNNPEYAAPWPYCTTGKNQAIGFPKIVAE